MPSVLLLVGRVSKDGKWTEPLVRSSDPETVRTALQALAAENERDAQVAELRRQAGL